MTKLCIYKESDLNFFNIILCLQEGHHYIGRDSLLTCTDRTVSRNHAKISVHRNGAIIQSVHKNPTLFKTDSCDLVQTLKENESISLNNGDRFALGEELDWYKVKIIITDDESSLLPNNFSIKREIDEDLTSCNKRFKTDSSSISNDLNVTIKQEPVCNENNNLLVPLPLILNEVKKEEVNSRPNSPNEPSTSHTTTVLPNCNSVNIPEWKRNNPSWRRERCWYRNECYRKNESHKENFSHPGDDDYDSDASDTRQVCPFGLSCYRVNLMHRREFKHFGRPAPRPPRVFFATHVMGCSCKCCKRKPGYESDCDTD